MNVETSTKEALIVLAIVLGVIIISSPKGLSAKLLKPDKADAKEVSNKENAMIALDAFMSAVENKESAKNLNALNQELGKKYGLRVYRSGKGFVARDAQGKDILYAK